MEVNTRIFITVKTIYFYHHRRHQSLVLTMLGPASTLFYQLLESRGSMELWNAS